MKNAYNLNFSFFKYIMHLIFFKRSNKAVANIFQSSYPLSLVKVEGEAKTKNDKLKSYFIICYLAVIKYKLN